MNDSNNETASKTLSESATNGSTGQATNGAMQPDDLHDLFETPANFNPHDEEDPLAQLRNDPNYSALIRDLEMIAKQARELFQPAAETPSDDLWTKIQSKLPGKLPDA